MSLYYGTGQLYRGVDGGSIIKLAKRVLRDKDVNRGGPKYSYRLRGDRCFVLIAFSTGDKMLG